MADAAALGRGYHGHFKCNRSKLTEMSVLHAHARDLWSTGDFGSTVNLEHVRAHYLGVHLDINPTGIVPKGPDTARGERCRPGARRSAEASRGYRHVGVGDGPESYVTIPAGRGFVLLSRDGVAVGESPDAPA